MQYDVLGLLDGEEEKEVEGKALAVRAESIIEKIKTREIKNNEEYENMSGFIKEVKLAIKGLNAYWDPDIKKAYSTTEGLRAKKKADIGPLQAAELIANQKMTTYYKAEEEKKRKAEEKRRVEQARLQKEAEEKAEEEREAKQAEENTEALLEDREAETVVVETVVAVEPPQEPVKETPKVSGISYAEKWRWECTDFTKVPDSLKKLDEVKINGLVTAMKGDFNYEGIRAYADKTLKTRI